MNLKETGKTSIDISQNVSVINIGQNEKEDYIYIIKGIIKNKELLKILNKLKFFEIDMKRIITNTQQNTIDLFIEFHLSPISVRLFEEKINEIGWEINN